MKLRILAAREKEIDIKKLGVAKVLLGGKKHKGSQEFVAYAMVAAKNYIFNSLYSPAFYTLALEHKAFTTEEQYKAAFLEVGKLALATRIRKMRNSLMMSIPTTVVNTSSPYYPPMGNRNYDASQGDVLEDFVKRALEFAPEYFDVDKTIDVTVPVDTVMAHEIVIPGFNVSSEYKTNFKNSVKRFRFVCPSVIESVKAIHGQRLTHYDADGNPMVPTTLEDYAGRTDEEGQRHRREFIEWVVRNRPIMAYIDILLDQQTLLSITNNDTFDTVQNQTVGAWAHNLLQYAFTPGSDSELVDSVQDISKISSFNKTSPVREVARTNADGLSITSSGDLRFLPIVDKGEQYEADVEDRGRQDDGDWALTDPKNPRSLKKEVAEDGTERFTSKRSLRDQIIYTDLKYGKFCYTDTEGKLVVQDIESWRPAALNSISKVMNYLLDASSTKSEAAWNDVSRCCKYARDNGFTLPQDEIDNASRLFYNLGGTREHQGQLIRALNEDGPEAFVIQLTRHLASLYGSEVNLDRRTPLTEPEKNIVGEFYSNRGVRLGDIGPAPYIPMLRLVYLQVKFTHDAYHANPDEFIRHSSVVSMMRVVAMATVIEKYGSRVDQVKQQDQQERAVYLQPNLADVKGLTVEGIPFVKGLRLMPHQVKAWNYIRNSPPNEVLDVSAGGGKTILALIDIWYNQGKKNVKKPLIMCPTYLVKNYFADAAYASQGRVNVVAITSGTLRRWGRDKLTNIIEKAPINTIFVAGFDFLRGGIKRISYGAKRIQISENAEFLRQFNFDGLWIDESHMLKNDKSLRTRSVARLIAGIPYRREMTGTYNPNDYRDVVGQFGLMDPSAFGDMDNFVSEYAEEVKGGRVYAWKQNAARKIRERMSEHSAYIKIGRKEWASLLPPRMEPVLGPDGQPVMGPDGQVQKQGTETFHPVELTAAQSDLYNVLLETSLKEIQEQMANDPKMARLMRAIEEKGDGDESVEEMEDDLMEQLLGVYIQRLERFLTAPMADEASQNVLTHPEDRMSPKARAVISICEQHLNRKIPGKIIVFTQYVESAKAIYESLPSHIKDRALLYQASKYREQTLAEFKSNPDKLIMIGCEKSLNTGHNFQFASRLIRVESVWNWGQLEQGESRVNRPNAKIEEFRTAIYVDYVFVNNTIDVTKMARLISKAVESAKFNEAEDERFQQLPSLEPVKMSLKVIEQRNDFRDPEHGLMEHFNTFQDMKVLEEITYQEFRENPNNRTEPADIPDGPILEGSGFLKEVPYVPEMELYAPEELGLVAFSDHINTLPGGARTADPTGWNVHTEYGDGTVLGFRRREDGTITSLRVLLPGGQADTIPVTRVWVITKESDSPKSIRQRIAELLATDISGTEVEYEAPPPSSRPIKTLKPTKETPRKTGKGLVKFDEIEKNEGFALEVASVFESVAFVVNINDPDTPVEELKRDGWISPRPFIYAMMRGPKTTRALIEKMEEQFEIPEPFASHLEDTIGKMKEAGAGTGSGRQEFFSLLQPGEIRNFLLENHRTAKPGQVKPYIIVHDDYFRGKPNPAIYVCLDKKSNPELMKVRKIVQTSKGPVIWKEDLGQDKLWKFLPKGKKEAAKYFGQLSSKFTISNKAEVENAIRNIFVVGGR
jgi:hypothetical protein